MHLTIFRLGVQNNGYLSLFVSDASGQGKSGQGSGLISSSTTTTCVPGFDLTCSPKVEVGITKPSVNKKALVLKRDSLPFNQSDTEIIPFKMDPSGSCGEKGIVCPSSSYDVGVKFTGQAASVTANVRGILLAKSSGAGSVCGALYVDLFVALGGGWWRAESSFEACRQVVRTRASISL